MIGGITPRPIGFCSTLDEDGVPNLAPFSYFTAAGHNPPLIFLSFTVTYVLSFLHMKRADSRSWSPTQWTQRYLQQYQVHEAVYGEHHFRALRRGGQVRLPLSGLSSTYQDLIATPL